MDHTGPSGMPRKPLVNADCPARNINILLVAHSDFRCTLVSELQNEADFRVEIAPSGYSGVESAQKSGWHLILLEDVLPDIDWVSALKKIRTISSVPIVILTDEHKESECITGLNLGADEYLRKDTSQGEFVARIRALLRRAGWISHETPTPVISELVVGALRLRLGTFSAFFGERALELTRTEFEVLLTLAKNPGKVCTREQLVESTKGGVWQVFDRAIDMHISALRRILGDESREPRFIQTVRGVGYSLTVPDIALPRPDPLGLMSGERPPQKFLPNREL
jgi:DNA-binding response OmpR family regulator